MKKVLALILAMLMLATAMVSCTDPKNGGDVTTEAGGDNGGDPTDVTTGEADVTTEGDEETTTDFPKDQVPPADEDCNVPDVVDTTLTIVDSSGSAFKIVYASEMSSSAGAYNDNNCVNVYKDMANQLATAIKNKFGITLTVTADKNAKANTRYNEILVGPTNREESDMGMMFCNGAKGFVVKAINKKLIINGYTGTTTKDAMDYFIDKVVAKAQNKLEFSSKDDYASEHTYNGATNTIAGYSYKTYTIVVPENAEYSALRTARRLQILIANRVGTIPAIVYDNNNKHEADFEILVGDTKRTSDSTKNVGKLEYVIAIKKARVEINAGSSWAFEFAAEYIEKSFLSEMNGAKYDAGEIVRTDISKSLSKDGNKVAAGKEGELRLVVHNVWGWHEYGSMGVWGCAPEHLNSAAQRNLAMAELYIDLGADVIALQEYTEHLLRNSTNRDISPILEAAGYGQVYTSSTVAKSATPIFYNKATLELLESDIINLMIPYPGCGGDKYMTIAVFKQISDGKVFGVISIHKDYRSGAEAESNRINMAKDAVAKANAIIEKYDCPVFVGGDFNCATGSKPYNEYTSAGFETAVKKAGETDKGASHLGGPTWNEQKLMFITNFSGTSMGSSVDSIDHIMVKGDSAGLVRYDLLTDVVSSSISDHLPQVLDFNLN